MCSRKMKLETNKSACNTATFEKKSSSASSHHNQKDKVNNWDNLPDIIMDTSDSDSDVDIINHNPRTSSENVTHVPKSSRNGVNVEWNHEGSARTNTENVQATKRSTCNVEWNNDHVYVGAKNGNRFDSGASRKEDIAGKYDIVNYI